MAFDNNKLGELRPNQIITTFGPGSIVDAVKDSVTVLDTNFWKEKGKKIIDGRLHPTLELTASICLGLPIWEMFRWLLSRMLTSAPICSVGDYLMPGKTLTWTNT